MVLQRKEEEREPIVRAQGDTLREGELDTGVGVHAGPLVPEGVRQE